jgi:hypothetical protein
MMELTYGELRQSNFTRGLLKIANCPQLKSPKLAYNVAKITAKCNDELTLANTMHEKLVDQYAKKDETGKLEPFNGRPGTFFIPEENAKEWEAKLTEFNSISFQIDRPGLQLEEVMIAELTPAEIGALEALLLFDEKPAPLAEVTPLAKV